MILNSEYQVVNDTREERADLRSRPGFRDVTIRYTLSRSAGDGLRTAQVIRAGVSFEMTP